MANDVTKLSIGKPDVRFYDNPYNNKTVICSDANATTIVEANGITRKILPMGTIMGGGVLANPDAMATAAYAVVYPTATLAFTDTDAEIKITGKFANMAGASIEIIDPNDGATANANQAIAIALTGNAISLTLGTDDTAATIFDSASAVAAALNSIDSVFHLYTIDATKPNGVVNAIAATNITGNSAGTDGAADGILFHEVDVTNGPANGVLMILGSADLDKMPLAPGPLAAASMKNLQFLRKKNYE